MAGSIEMREQPSEGHQNPWRVWGLRLAGLVLLAVLLMRVDVGRTAEVLRGANLYLIGAAIAGNAVLLFIKTVRWQHILRAQKIHMKLWPAYLAYFGSLFVGYLTPGRLGEFVRALHVSRDARASSARAFSSVLADRLFDLYALVLVGGVATLALVRGGRDAALLVGFGVLAVLPLAVLLHPALWRRACRVGKRAGTWGRKLFSDEGWLSKMQRGLRDLAASDVAWAALLTVTAYLFYFGQGYLLALALGLPIGYVTTGCAVAVGSLVALVPLSIAGLGTREAAIVAYLSAVGVSAEAALGFSLLIFLVFHVANGALGALAWSAKPAPLSKSASAS